MSPRTIQERVVRSLALVPVRERHAQDRRPGDSVRDYLLERQRAVPRRRRPDGLPAPLPEQRRSPPSSLGTVGEISPSELKLRALPRRRARARRRQGRASSAPTTATCAAVDGAPAHQVDALGQPEAARAQARDPVAGQRAAARRSTSTSSGRRRRVARQAIATRPGHGGRVRRDGPAQRRGPRDGLGPVVRPVDPLAPDHPEAPTSSCFGPNAGSPLFNRAIARPVSDRLDVQADHRAAPRLQPGHHHAEHADQRPGLHRDRRREAAFCNAGKAVNGTRRPAAGAPGLLRRLLLHARPRPQPARGPAAPEVAAPPRARARTTGIDLPGEVAGPRARPPLARRRSASASAAAAKRTPASRLTALVGCGISDMRPWTVGDNVNLAVGQGDLQASPLQMAVAYAAIENGGRVVAPAPRRSRSRTRTAARSSRSSRRAARRVKIDPAARAGDHRRPARRGHAAGGTSADVFKGWNQKPLPGLRQDRHRRSAPASGDQSWYVCFVPEPRAARSSSRSPSRRAASAPRPPRRPRA